MQDRVRDWLFRQALPLWADAGIDAEGRFFEKLDFDGRPVTGVPRRTRVQARQTYVFIQAAALGWTDGAPVARAALDALIRRNRRDDGLLNGGLDLAAEAKALGLKVDEGNGHEGVALSVGAAQAELGSAHGREGGSTILSASYQSPGPLDKPARVTSRCRLQRKPCLAKPATLPKPTGR